MQLTRRDAIAALTAGGGLLGAGAAVRSPNDGGLRDAPGVDDAAVETLVAVAQAVYPSAVTGTRAFVEAYAEPRLADRPDHAAGVAAAADRLDDHARGWYGAAFVELDRETRERLLREMGVDTADPAPNGTTAERVRHFLANEVLYALFTSPTGGRLVGIENPQGYPGGLDTYRRDAGE